MATEKKNIITPKFRVSFAHVWEPRETQSGQKMYSVMMLFDKQTDITALKDLVRDAVLAQWPDAEKRPKGLINPIKDGDTDTMQDGSLRKAKYPEMAGHWIVNAMSMRKPQVVDHNVEDILDRELFYSGCFARASVNAFCYYPDRKNPQKKYGVGIGLNNLQKLADGDRLAGGTNARDDFAPVENPDAPAAAVPSNDEDMFA
jgi:hypothetical protein